jgi:phosphatidylserine decarboxylase
VAVGIAGLFVIFFRDPERRLTPNPSVAYAAADGVVTSIEQDVADPWLPNGAGIRISTFLGLHNVHVTRSPVAGMVTQTESVRGGFAPALLTRSGNNTRRRVAIDGAAGRVVVVQVAGLLARKISGWVEQGESVAAGQRVGMIHLGSRTDVLLPRDCADILVSRGERVRAGRTELARYRARA